MCAHHFNNHGYCTYWQVQSKFHHIFVFFLLHPLLLLKPVLPLGAEGWQRTFCLSWCWSIALPPFHSIPLSFKIFCILSSQVCRRLPFGLFPLLSSFWSLPMCSSVAYQTILGYRSSPILTTCPNHHNSSNSLIFLRFCYICSKKPDTVTQQA